MPNQYKYGRQHKGIIFAHHIKRILRELGINAKQLARRLHWEVGKPLSWAEDYVRRLLDGELEVERDDKIMLAVVLGRVPQDTEVRGEGSPWVKAEAFTDKQLDSLFLPEHPDLYRY